MVEGSWPSVVARTDTVRLAPAVDAGNSIRGQLDADQGQPHHRVPQHTAKIGAAQQLGVVLDPDPIAAPAQAEQAQVGEAVLDVEDGRLDVEADQEEERWC